MSNQTEKKNKTSVFITRIKLKTKNDIAKLRTTVTLERILELIEQEEHAIRSSEEIISEIKMDRFKGTSIK